MVGPLSSEEIEDVVSSVRRLVSNELRPRTLSRDLNSERLLLTPALRVVSETSVLAPLILDVLILDAPIADPLAGDYSAQSDTVHADLTDQVPSEVLVDALDVEIEPVKPEETVWEDVIWAEPEVSLSEMALGAEEAEELGSPAEDVLTAFGAEAEDVPEPWAQVETEWAEDDPIPFVPLRRRAENLAARLASGTILNDLRAEPELDPAQTTTLEPSALDAAGEAPSSVVDAEGSSTEENRSAPTSLRIEMIDADGTPLAALDEAALRDVVRSMIRDELQGPLGERITRSVRKLVRAEVNRALVARDI